MRFNEVAAQAVVDSAFVQVELPNPASTDNLATLSDLDDGIILQYLRERYHCDQIYVCGSTNFNPSLPICLPSKNFGGHTVKAVVLLSATLPQWKQYSTPWMIVPV